MAAVEGANKLYPFSHAAAAAAPVPRRPAGAVKRALNPLNGRSLYRCDDTQKQSDNSSCSALPPPPKRMPAPPVSPQLIYQGGAACGKNDFFYTYILWSLLFLLLRSTAETAAACATITQATTPAEYTTSETTDIVRV